MEYKYYKYKFKYLNLIGSGSGEYDVKSLEGLPPDIIKKIFLNKEKEIFLKNCKKGNKGGIYYDKLQKENQKNKKVILCLLKLNEKYICKKKNENKFYKFGFRR